MTALTQLSEFGQSFWLDNLSRRMIADGELRRRVEQEKLAGITSNPAIFAKSIGGGDDYDAQIREVAAGGTDVEKVYEALVTTDVRDACDVLRPVFDRTGGADGFVSLEVSPHLARDAEGSLIEARRLWQTVDRPNLMIKIPGTAEGVPAIEQLLFEGINVNITLLFAVDAYRAVAEAHMRALERRIEAGRPLDGIASVTSFFLSRIDTMVDKALDDLGAAGGEATTESIRELFGKAAIANAKLAYRHLQANIESDRWKRLAAQGARVQRLLWASTSTKNPAYSDVMYVDPLIGPHTVNTMPEDTAAAFADHGKAAVTVDNALDDAEATMQALDGLGIDFAGMAQRLEAEGIQKFIDPYDSLIEALGRKCAA